MVLSNAGKAARNAASISNNTKIFGIMGGLAPRHGVPSSVRSNYQMRVSTKQVIPLAPDPGLTYMKQNSLLSVNPQASGGVGRRVNTAYGNPCGCSSSSDSSNSDNDPYTSVWADLYTGTSTSTGVGRVLPSPTTINNSALNYLTTNLFMYYGYDNRLIGEPIIIETPDSSNSVVGRLWNDAGLVFFSPEINDGGDPPEQNILPWYTENMEIKMTFNILIEPYTYKLSGVIYTGPYNNPAYKVEFPTNVGSTLTT